MDSAEKGQGEAGAPQKKLVSPAGKHLLHRLPTFSGPTRIAQSKASAKEQSVEEEAINVIPVEDTLENDKTDVAPAISAVGEEDMECQVDKKTAKSKNVTSSETASNGDHPTSSENVEKMDVDETAQVPVPSPIKKRTRRSVSINSNVSKTESEDGVLNTVQESPKITLPEKLSSDPAPSTTGEEIEKKKKKNRYKMSPEELKKPSSWLVGDLVWSKVSGHPWWPCMVSYDPNLGIHTRLITKKNTVLQRSYHVQYFGARAERGWSRESAIVEFKGVEGFEAQVKQGKVYSNQARSRNKNVFDLAASKKAAWTIAVDETVEAMKLSLNDRKSQLTFQYVHPTKKKATAEPSTSEARPEENKEKRVRKSTGSIATKVGDVSHAELMNGLLAGRKKKRLSEPPKRAKSVFSTKSVRGVGASSDIVVSSGFDVYYEKNAKKVKADNPKFNDESVKQYLQHHWIGLSHDQKQEYEGTVFLEDQGGRRLSARVKKPSKKVREAVEDMSAEENTEEPPAKKKKSPESKRQTSVPKSEGPRIVEDTLDDTINCFLYGDDYQKAIHEEIIEKKEKKSIKTKKPVNVGKPVKAEKVAGMRKVTKTKKEASMKTQQRVERGQKRKSPEPVGVDSTDLDSQDEDVIKPKVKRQKVKDVSSDGDGGKKKFKEDSSDTDSVLEKKPRKKKVLKEDSSDADWVLGKKPRKKKVLKEDSSDTDWVLGKKPRKKKVLKEDSSDTDSMLGKKTKKKKLKEDSSDTDSVLGKNPRKKKLKEDSSDTDSMLGKKPRKKKLKEDSSDTDSMLGKKPRKKKLKEDSSDTDSMLGKKPRKKKLKEDSSDTDSVLGKKPRKKKVDTAESVSESDPMEYDTMDEDITCGKPGVYSYKPGKVCQICEKPDDLIQCEGTCIGSFHTACLGMTVAPTAEFKCDECLSGLHPCFVCKKSDKETRRCSIGMCGKFYHEDCLKPLHQAKVEGKSFICPLHGCATCYANNPKSMKVNKGRLVKCTRCPTTYHSTDLCIAAGCEQLSACSMVCSKHFKAEKAKVHHAHVNVSWCFSCSKGGTLLCCESCPAAFHHQCLGIDFPEGSWFCDQCVTGKTPLYDDIVWVKLGNYRWWPAAICHPRNVPKNIQEKKHQVGEFPVHFFGSKDYFWTHRARVFLFQDGDKGSRETANTKRLEKVFKDAVLEASEAFQNWKKIKETKRQQDTVRIEKKPPPYKYIKVNVPVGNVQVNKANLEEIPRCQCTEEMACARGSDCLNRMLMYECHPSICPAGEKCQNQRFQKRQYPEVVPYKTPGRGWGLKSRFDIKKREFVNEYVGELIDEEECRRRIKKAHDDNSSSFYLLTLDSRRVIDAGPKGNLSRFMNHSCEPNCVTSKWNVNGDVRVGLFATRDIPAGSELTFNYNLDCLGNDKKVCKCGAPRCSGFLGVPPKTEAAMTRMPGKHEKLKKKKKKRKLIHKPKHEDDCFRCGEGGTLVMCDLPGCTKAYHMDCLTLDKLPYGKWICPWHHCDECGKKAVRKCVECPNSFCLAHTEGNITEMPDGKLFCDEHQELIDSLLSSSTSATSSDGETNGDDTAGEDAESTNVLPKNKSLPEKSEHLMDIDSDSVSSGGETQMNGSNSSDIVNNTSDNEGKKKGRGRSRKNSADSDNTAKKSVANLTKEKGEKKGKRETLKHLKGKKDKKLKDSNGKVKRKKSVANENNNDLKQGEQKDLTATDDDDYPSLVIDIPGC